ncbi:uncharacterized protein AMSG_01809 [Thecamonas trahens ATCC 50062]|uniref:Transmembrane protein n=1 Tax=Thecamonas trahens ATCC 50062 TaxID=461836 RepID=A0A0L0DU19_THETB|nr:hypothetical protein AMSG_01809 [Thecamonas trahens ATCC 50062]KNC55546.1 hypothetical protein AMSG_01809 [Thecamonas trahens ATCC 50062]|eukprot:XP_013761320.1 hypothetical protein AMSG_01809 [Thecamonas trahens ATCC 50062]
MSSPFVVSNVVDPSNDGRPVAPSGDPAMAVFIDDGAHDVTRVRSVSSAAATATIVTTREVQPTGGSSAPHLTIFLTPASLADARAGYVAAPGLYAVAMIRDGLGWVARMGRHTEVEVHHAAWAHLMEPDAAVAVVVELRSDSGTLANFDDDVIDFVPQRAALPPVPSPAPQSSTPHLALAIDGIGSEWARLIENPPGLPVRVAAEADVANDGVASSISVRSELEPANDYREVIVATDDDAVAVFATTHAPTGTPPTPSARHVVYIVTDTPSAGYELAPGIVAVATIDDGIGYVYSGPDQLAHPSLRYAAVTSGNKMEAFMAADVWAHLVSDSAVMDAVVVLIDSATGLADWTPDAAGSPSSSGPPSPPPPLSPTDSGPVPHHDKGSNSSAAGVIAGTSVALLLLACCVVCVLWMWRRRSEAAKAGVPVSASSASLTSRSESAESGEDAASIEKNNATGDAVSGRESSSMSSPQTLPRTLASSPNQSPTTRQPPELEPILSDSTCDEDAHVESVSCNVVSQSMSRSASSSDGEDVYGRNYGASSMYKAPRGLQQADSWAADSHASVLGAVVLGERSDDNDDASLSPGPCIDGPGQMLRYQSSMLNSDATLAASSSCVQRLSSSFTQPQPRSWSRVFESESEQKGQSIADRRKAAKGRRSRTQGDSLLASTLARASQSATKSPARLLHHQSSMLGDSSSFSNSDDEEDGHGTGRLRLTDTDQHGSTSTSRSPSASPSPASTALPLRAARSRSRNRGPRKLSHRWDSSIIGSTLFHNISEIDNESSTPRADSAASDDGGTSHPERHARSSHSGDSGSDWNCDDTDDRADSE